MKEIDLDFFKTEGIESLVQFTKMISAPAKEVVRNTEENKFGFTPAVQAGLETPTIQPIVVGKKAKKKKMKFVFKTEGMSTASLKQLEKEKE